MGILKFKEICQNGNRDHACSIFMLSWYYYAFSNALQSPHIVWIKEFCFSCSISSWMTRNTFGKWTEKKLNEVFHEHRNYWQWFRIFFSSNVYFLPSFLFPVWVIWGKKSLEFLVINISPFPPSSDDSSFQAATDPLWGFMLTLKSIINDYGEWKEQQRVHREAKGFSKFLVDIIMYIYYILILNTWKILREKYLYSSMEKGWLWRKKRKEPQNLKK